jgi:hypothetical protein
MTHCVVPISRDHPPARYGAELTVVKMQERCKLNSRERDE